MTDLTDIPEPIKKEIFKNIIKDFNCGADKKLNDELLDAANSLDKAFKQWKLEKLV